MKKQGITERGKFKEEINSILYNNLEIRNVILGDTSTKNAKEIRQDFKEHVKTHLFIDDTIEDTSTYIFYDVLFPFIHSNTKECHILMYVICHRDILDDYHHETIIGNRIDVLSQLIESCIIDDEKIANSFGIGQISLDSVDIYNSRKFYGSIMEFSVPNFR